MNSRSQPCELCALPGGTILWESSACRVVRVADPDYPGFCRVIWKAHVAEMSDLPDTAQHYLMGVVFAVERVVRSLFGPDKINLASLGNVVPHLHWHVIPRWADDRHFPEPIWGKVRRESAVERQAVGDAKLTAVLAAELAGFRDGVRAS